MPDMTQPKHAGALRLPRHWPVYLFALPAAVAIWSGWVGLGQLAGFGIVHPLPGIVPGFKLNTAITLPVGVEAYGAYALGAWLNPATAGTAKAFARRSAIGALILGALGQISYHLLAADHAARAPWIVTVAVACMPVVTLGFGAALTHLLRAGDAPAAEAIGEPAGMPAEQPARAPLGMPADVPAELPASEPAASQPPARQKSVRPRRATAADPDSELARKRYRESVRRAEPLSPRALAAQFDGKGRTWAANRIAECEDGPRLAKVQ